MVVTNLRRILRHPISRNVVALGWIQVATFLVPLITLPYVARVLSQSEFGLVVFSQGFAIVLTIFIDWGFTYYGVRAVAAARHDRAELANVVARVRGAQLFLAFASIPVALACLLLVPKLHDHPGFLVLAWIAAVSTGLMTNWYFVGIEQLRRVALIQLSLRVFAAALTFALVTQSSDGWIVLALYAASSVAMWLILDVLMYRQVPLRVPPLRASIEGVRGAERCSSEPWRRRCTPRSTSSCSDCSRSAIAVAHFGASERVLRASLAVIAPIGGAVYPRLAYLQSTDRSHRARQFSGLDRRGRRHRTTDRRHARLVLPADHPAGLRPAVRASGRADPAHPRAHHPAQHRRRDRRNLADHAAPRPPRRHDRPPCGHLEHRARVHPHPPVRSPGHGLVGRVRRGRGGRGRDLRRVPARPLGRGAAAAAVAPPPAPGAMPRRAGRSAGAGGVPRRPSPTDGLLRPDPADPRAPRSRRGQRAQAPRTGIHRLAAPPTHRGDSRRPPATTVTDRETGKALPTDAPAVTHGPRHDRRAYSEPRAASSARAAAGS